MSERKNQHYVPQFYLRGFESKRKWVWVYEKNKPYTPGQKRGRNNPTLSPIISTGSSDYYYAIPSLATGEVDYTSIEQRLEEKERICKPALERLRKGIFPSEADKKLLTDYLLLFWKRVPAASKRAETMWSEIYQKSMPPLMQQVERIEKSDPDSKFAPVKNFLKKFEEHYSLKPPPAVLFGVMLEESQVMRDALLAMTWRVLTPYEGYFVTSDNPFYFHNFGVSDKRAEVSFPISTKYALWLSWFQAPEGCFATHSNLIDEINRRTVQNASSEFYAFKEDEAIHKLSTDSFSPHLVPPELDSLMIPIEQKASTILIDFQILEKILARLKG